MVGLEIWMSASGVNCGYRVLFDITDESISDASA